MIFIALIIVSGNILALGVTPARKVIDFQPGVQHDVSFSLLNDENKEMTVVIYAEGELADRIIVSENVINFGAVEGSRDITYSFKLPDDMLPGTSETKIVARELPKTTAHTGAQVGGTVAVVHQLQIQKPYPGKYALAELKIAETGSTENVNFIVPVSNFGTQDIVNARGIIDIFGPTNEKIATVETNEIGIVSGERTELTAVWEGASFGRYYAVLTVVYDGEVTPIIEETFGVGVSDLEILQIKTNDDFRLGEIAKFNILVDNGLAVDLNQVFAEMIVYTLDGEEVIRFKSSTESIESLGKQELVAYWDTEGIKEDEYRTTLIIHYDNQKIEEDVKAVVSLTSIEFSDFGLTGEAVYGVEGIDKTTVLIGLVAILVIVNIGWFVFYFRRKKRKR